VPGPEFLDYFAVVEDVHSTCGRAARQGARTAVADVRADPGFTPHQEIAAAAGFRAVQSTPLVDYAGHLIGWSRRISSARTARQIATCGSWNCTPTSSARR